MDNAFDFQSLPMITQIRLTSFTGEFGGQVCLNTNKITPRQQKGPTCGLVAISMCLEHFGIKTNPETILEKAKEMGFTKQGEMYSAESLASLTNEFLPNSSKIRKMPSPKEFTQSICDGKQMLIAYDCGPNYQPVYVRGHSAHWLLACGFVKKQEVDGFVETRETVAETDEIAIIGYQGKSTYDIFDFLVGFNFFLFRNLNVFPFNEVVASNAQLLEAGLKRDPSEYIIPDPHNLSEIRNCVVEVCINN